MIVVCKPEESKDWYEKLWRMSVELFRSLDIPVRQLECCSGDLADLKVKSCDIEAWSPRQQKFFEVCSCSNLGDAQARRLRIRYKDENGKMQLCHTLNNTCVAPPRMLIAFLENNLQADGTVRIPRSCGPIWAARNYWSPRKNPICNFSFYLYKSLSPFPAVGAARSLSPDHSVPLQRLHSGQISESHGLQWLQYTYTGAHSFHTGESHD